MISSAAVYEQQWVLLSSSNVDSSFLFGIDDPRTKSSGSGGVLKQRDAKHQLIFANATCKRTESRTHVKTGNRVVAERGGFGVQGRLRVSGRRGAPRSSLLEDQAAYYGCRPASHNDSVWRSMVRPPGCNRFHQDEERYAHFSSESAVTCRES